jgi:hypothetical protein
MPTVLRVGRYRFYFFSNDRGLSYLTSASRPEIDEDLSVANLLTGADWQSA